MRFVYPARLRRTGPDEVVVSFRDLPECLTSGADEAEALAEAADALDVAIAGRIVHPPAEGDPMTISGFRVPGSLKNMMSPCRRTRRRRPPW